jgi:hypothetical protein
VVGDFLDLSIYCFSKQWFILIVKKGFKKIMKSIHLVQVVLKTKRRKKHVNSINFVAGIYIVIQEKVLARHSDRLIARHRINGIIVF